MWLWLLGYVGGVVVALLHVADEPVLGWCVWGVCFVAGAVLSSISKRGEEA